MNRAFFLVGWLLAVGIAGGCTASPPAPLPDGGCGVVECERGITCRTGGCDGPVARTSCCGCGTGEVDQASCPHADGGNHTGGDGSSNSDGTSSGDGQVGDGASACGAGCRLYSNYCDGCTCLALRVGQSNPVCNGMIVTCLHDPCEGLVSACDESAGTCVAQ